MNLNRLAVGFAIGLVMAAVAISRADDKEFLIEGTLSGSSITAEIDTNGDGLRASLTTGILVSTRGRFTFQSLTELRPPISPTGACPSGDLELPILLNRAVNNDQKTGDQLFPRVTSGAVCVNPTTGILSASEAGIFTGGTGQFAGATGSFTVNITGSTLVSSSGRSFANVTGTLTGTLITVEDDEE